MPFPQFRGDAGTPFWNLPFSPFLFAWMPQIFGWCVWTRVDIASIGETFPIMILLARIVNFPRNTYLAFLWALYELYETYKTINEHVFSPYLALKHPKEYFKYFIVYWSCRKNPQFPENATFEERTKIVEDAYNEIINVFLARFCRTTRSRTWLPAPTHPGDATPDRDASTVTTVTTATAGDEDHEGKGQKSTSGFGINNLFGKHFSRRVSTASTATLDEIDEEKATIVFGGDGACDEQKQKSAFWAVFKRFFTKPFSRRVSAANGATTGDGIYEKKRKSVFRSGFGCPFDKLFTSCKSEDVLPIVRAGLVSEKSSKPGIFSRFFSIFKSRNKPVRPIAGDGAADKVKTSTASSIKYHITKFFTQIFGRRKQETPVLPTTEDPKKGKKQKKSAFGLFFRRIWNLIKCGCSWIRHNTASAVSGFFIFFTIGHMSAWGGVTILNGQLASHGMPDQKISILPSSNWKFGGIMLCIEAFCTTMGALHFYRGWRAGRAATAAANFNEPLRMEALDSQIRHRVDDRIEEILEFNFVRYPRRVFSGQGTRTISNPARIPSLHHRIEHTHPDDMEYKDWETQSAPGDLESEQYPGNGKVKQEAVEKIDEQTPIDDSNIDLERGAPSGIDFADTTPAFPEPAILPDQYKLTQNDHTSRGYGSRWEFSQTNVLGAFPAAMPAPIYIPKRRQARVASAGTPATRHRGAIYSRPAGAAAMMAL